MIARICRQARTRTSAAWPALAAGGLCGLLLLATAPITPMVWDEGDAILRAEQLPGAWPFTTQREGHPAVYGIVIALGQWVGHGWLPPLLAARLGPIVLFAAAAGAMFYRLARDWSFAAAGGGVAALLLLPRLFAHAHFASFDGPLTSCWIIAWACFGALPGPSLPPNARPAWMAVVGWGIALGATMGCKASGWLAIAPPLAWAAIWWRSGFRRALPIGLGVALLAFFLFNPPLWREPVAGWATFFDLNLHRAAQPGLNISTQFFGRLYNLDYPLPWYNTLVWTAITVPVGLLLLAMAGVGSAARQARRRPEGMMLVFQWLVLLVVRALPGTPPHDAERLILPSFAFLAALAGLGCHTILAARTTLVRGLAVAMVYLGSATSLVWHAPQWLSYYSLLIGGLPGATAAGMEPAYYWDGLDRGVLDWLNAHTAAGEKVRFAAAPDDNLLLLRQWGLLRPATDADAPGEFRWYVVQNRPGGMQPVDRWLMAHVPPALRKTIRRGGWGPWRLDVPIIEVFPYTEYERAKAACKPSPPPEATAPPRPASSHAA